MDIDSLLPFVLIGGLVAGLAVYFLMRNRDSELPESPALDLYVVPRKPQSDSAEEYEHETSEVRITSSFGVSSYEQTDEDLEFERIVRTAIGEEKIIKAFYSKIAGTTHLNDDGTRRGPIISRCLSAEAFDLVPEPPESRFPEGVALHRREGGQVGWIEARLAGEMRRAAAKGFRYFVIFRRPTHHPTTSRVVGGVLYVVMVSPDYEDT